MTRSGTILLKAIPSSEYIFLGCGYVDLSWNSDLWWGLCWGLLSDVGLCIYTCSSLFCSPVNAVRNHARSSSDSYSWTSLNEWPILVIVSLLIHCHSTPKYEIDSTWSCLMPSSPDVSYPCDIFFLASWVSLIPMTVMYVCFSCCIQNDIFLSWLMLMGSRRVIGMNIDLALWRVFLVLILHKSKLPVLSMVSMVGTILTVPFMFWESSSF